jgi:hypothetical protein
LFRRVITRNIIAARIAVALRVRGTRIKCKWY